MLTIIGENASVITTFWLDLHYIILENVELVYIPHSKTYEPWQRVQNQIIR